MFCILSIIYIYIYICIQDIENFLAGAQKPAPAKTPCTTDNTSLKPGEACKLPFEYRGKKYDKCTYDYSKSKPWCQTSSSWGFCNDSCSHDHNSGM